MNKKVLAGGAGVASLFALGLWPQPVLAQEQTESETIVVTGSHIRGTPEDAALPVNVITAEDIQAQGSPSVIDIIKQLPASAAVLGDTNQFDGRASILSTGTATVNLRGLGSGRTLVLLNGRRFTPSPRTDGVDVNLFPMAAIGRIEVLKDGAAATYGSDAIAGVVNFITRNDLDGFELQANYGAIQDSDGEYRVALNWGYQAPNADVLLSAAYQHRSELAVADRDWALRPYLENPQGGWSAYGQPGTYFGGLGAFRDPACGQEGTFGTIIPGFPACYYQLSQTYNLIEETDQLQLYGEVNFDLSDSVAFHGEALFARTEIPFLNSTSSPALQSPTALTTPVGYAGFYTMSTVGPNANPAAVAFAAANPGLPPDFFGNYIAYLFRPYGIGGNPLYGNGGLVGENTSESYRVSGGFSGDLDNGIHWDTAITYSVDENTLVSRDGVVTRLQRALNGLGGPDCPVVGGTPGVGPCFFFNPFSSAVETNVFSGMPNPTYDPAIANDPRFGNNDPEFANWLTPLLTSVSRTRLFTWDTVVDGELPIDFGAGNVAWAAGMQFRRTFLEVEVDPLYDVDANPCIDSPDFGDDSCITTPGAANGPLTFYVQYRNLTEHRDTWALFGEASIPVTEALQVDVAARYEDHADFGTTFNPKVSARLALGENFALRGSVGSSFREPLPVHTIETPLTAVAFLGGTLRQIRTAGNPDLEPEEAVSYNVGAIFSSSSFNATIDYWHFDFSDPITVEPFAAMYDALFPAVGPSNCGNAAYAQLEARFDFGGLACSSANLRRINTLWNNGAGVETSGVDVSADYTFDNVFGGGSLTIGGDASYVFNYEIDSTSVAGVNNIQPGFDAVGFLNYGTNAYPLPQWKANAFLEINSGWHSFRAALHYVDGYTDQRTSLFTTPVNSNPGPGGPGTGTGAYNAANDVLIPGGQDIDAFVTADFVYRLSLPGETTASIAVLNAFDEDPPFARLDMNYDPFTSNPAGRIIRLGLAKRF